MALSQRLDLRQGQSLVMTPQLQQAIKLLQMSNIELQAFVEAELERNPLLERDERAEVKKQAEAPTGADMAEALASNAHQAERLQSLDTDLENVYPNESRSDRSERMERGMADSGWSSLRPAGGLSLDSEDFDFGAMLSKSETLADHLTAQLTLAIAEPADRIVGQHLIGMVNEAGYLTGSAEDIAQQLGTDALHVARVLGVLKTFDPAGVFARDLRECLEIQLRDRGRFDPAMAALLDRLDLVAKHDLTQLRSLCKVDMEDIRDMIAELKTLNPKPGNAFGFDPVQPVVPDVFVRASQDGSWIVELNSETLPRVLISNQYMSKVKPSAAREEDKNYLCSRASTSAPRRFSRSPRKSCASRTRSSCWA
jgi:RNA polymerase sigma-54 factor